MIRRDFLKTGVGGTAISLAQGVPSPVNSPASGEVADPGIVVIGADGSVPSKPIVDKYISAAADVWFYLPNLPEFSADLEFLDSDPRIKLAKSVADIRGNKQAGKASMVIGWQNSAALEEGPGNDWRNSRPPRTKLREYYELGLRVANLSYGLSNQFGGGMLDPKAPLTTQGKYLVGKMQDMGILVDCCGHTSEQTALKRLVGIDHIAIGTDFTSDVEAADPSQLFQFPPEMM